MIEIIMNIIMVVLFGVYLVFSILALVNSNNNRKTIGMLLRFDLDRRGDIAAVGKRTDVVNSKLQKVCKHDVWEYETELPSPMCAIIYNKKCPTCGVSERIYASEYIKGKKENELVDIEKARAELEERQRKVAGK